MKIHIVQKGDTLWKLAKQYQIDFEQLKAANTQLSNPDMIMPGMKIKIPTGGVPVKKEMPVKEQPTFKQEQPKQQIPQTYQPVPPVQTSQPQTQLQQLQPLQTPYIQQPLQTPQQQPIVHFSGNMNELYQFESKEPSFVPQSESGQKPPYEQQPPQQQEKPPTSEQPPYEFPTPQLPQVPPMYCQPMPPPQCYPIIYPMMSPCTNCGTMPQMYPVMQPMMYQPMPQIEPSMYGQQMQQQSFGCEPFQYRYQDEEQK